MKTEAGLQKGVCLMNRNNFEPRYWTDQLGINKKLNVGALRGEVFKGLERAGSPRSTEHIAWGKAEQVERESIRQQKERERESGGRGGVRDWRPVVNSKIDRPFIDSLVLDSLFHFHLPIKITKLLRTNADSPKSWLEAEEDKEAKADRADVSFSEFPRYCSH